MLQAHDAGGMPEAEQAGMGRAYRTQNQTAKGDMKSRKSLTASAAAAALLLLSACAGPRVDGEWTSPDFTVTSLQGRPVMVACSAQDDTLRRICEDRLAARINEAGARAVRAPEPPAGGLQTGDDRALAAARSAGAQALVRTSLLTAGVTAGGGPGPSIGIGVGGGRGGLGIGGGLSLPIGGTRTAAEAFTASTSVLDVTTGQPIWSVRTSTPASTDMAGQVDQLTAAAAEAMRRAGLF
jgi:hypothetical protein